jgi:hypothetical protein
MGDSDDLSVGGTWRMDGSSILMRTERPKGTLARARMRGTDLQVDYFAAAVILGGLQTEQGV